MHQLVGNTLNCCSLANMLMMVFKNQLPQALRIKAEPWLVDFCNTWSSCAFSAALSPQKVLAEADGDSSKEESSSAKSTACTACTACWCGAC